MREFQHTPAGVKAAELVTGDRQATYGDPLISLNRIASLWGALLAVDITPRQVAHMMILLKVSRDQATPNADNEIDICGYAHLLQMEREDTESKPRPDMVGEGLLNGLQGEAYDVHALAKELENLRRMKGTPHDRT